MPSNNLARLLPKAALALLAAAALSACAPQTELEADTNTPRRVTGLLRVANLTDTPVEVIYGTATVATPLQPGASTPFQKNPVGDRPAVITLPGKPDPLKITATVQEDRETTVFVFGDGDGLQTAFVTSQPVPATTESPSIRLLQANGSSVTVEVDGQKLDREPITLTGDNVQVTITLSNPPSGVRPIVKTLALDPDGHYTVIAAQLNGNPVATILQDNPKLLGVGEAGASGN